MSGEPGEKPQPPEESPTGVTRMECPIECPRCETKAARSIGAVAELDIHDVQGLAEWGLALKQAHIEAEGRAKNWEADALLRAQNSDYWKGQAEKAEQERDEARKELENLSCTSCLDRAQKAESRVTTLQEALRELAAAVEERIFVDAVGDPNGPAFRRMKAALAAAAAAAAAALDALEKAAEKEKACP